MRVVERGEVGGRGCRDGAGLRVGELQVVDRALFALKLAQRLHQRLRRFEAGGEAAGDLAAERDAALLGQVALLGEAELADQLLEAIGVELAVGALEVRILQDRLHGVGVGLAEPEPARVLVERCFGDRLLQHLAIDPDRARLIRRQRPAELAADLLQTVVIGLAELLGGDFGAADLGERRPAEAAEYVGNTPDSEADDQDAHHDRHDGLANPVG